MSGRREERRTQGHGPALPPAFRCRKDRWFPSKPLANQRDLALALFASVGAACRPSFEDPQEAATVTARGNLVAVISNGTAVLGLRPIGALAPKPVAEGKGVLFKVRRHQRLRHRGRQARPGQADRHHRLAGADLRRHQPEDIKAPECF